MADDRETAKNNGISNHHLPRTQRAPQFRNANILQCGRSQDLVSLREEEEEIQSAAPGAVHDRGKSEFGEGSKWREGEREVASLAMGKRKKEGGSSQRGFN